MSRPAGIVTPFRFVIANKPKNRVKRGARKRRTSHARTGLAAFTGAKRRSPSFSLAQLNSLHVAKFIVGILLLPICWVSLETFLVVFRAGAIESHLWKQPEFLFFSMGALFWVVLFFGMRMRWMTWLYVAGHELTHAFFVQVCRGNVSKIHISSNGGHILTNRNNFLISLSPYLFPFYTTIVIGIWAALERWAFDFSTVHTYWLYGVIGLTWMFHLTYTVWMIGRDQPDVEQNGKLFSFSLIFVANMIVITSLLVIASPSATFHGYGQAFVTNTETLAGRLWESTKELWSVLPL